MLIRLRQTAPLVNWFLFTAEGSLVVSTPFLMPWVYSVFIQGPSKVRSQAKSLLERASLNDNELGRTEESRACVRVRQATPPPPSPPAPPRLPPPPQTSNQYTLFNAGCNRNRSKRIACSWLSESPTIACYELTTATKVTLLRGIFGGTAPALKYDADQI